MYKPQYIISNTILRQIGIIEACREVIDHAPLLPYYEKKFQSDALVRSIHHGTHIEGNELNFSQAERVVLGQQIIASERDIQEVINYRKVMEYLDELDISSSDISEDLLCYLHQLTVHKILPEELSGKVRGSQVVVKNSKTGEVSFRPPTAEQIKTSISDFIAFIKSPDSKDIHPILKSGIAHYELVRIHPFVDGNGRVARALSTMILHQEGYDIRRFFSLEEYYDNDASEYYKALQSVSLSQGDLTAWLEYFTKGLMIELMKIKEQVEHVSVDAKIKQKLGGKPLMLSDRQLKIIEYIQKIGYLENKGFKSLFPMVSEDTVLNELKELVKHGVVKKQGVTKAAKYVMS